MLFFAYLPQKVAFSLPEPCRNISDESLNEPTESSSADGVRTCQAVAGDYSTVW